MQLPSQSAIIVVLEANMALFFNLSLLEQEAENNDEKFLKLLKYHHEKTIVVPKKEKYKPLTKSLAGNSFILNPNPVLYSTDRKLSDIVQYIKLAGRRDLLLYRTYKIKYLDLSFFPDLNIQNIKNNPLLTITNKQIKFKHEEDHGTKV